MPGAKGREQDTFRRGMRISMTRQVRSTAVGANGCNAGTGQLSARHAHVMTRRVRSTARLRARIPVMLLNFPGTDRSRLLHASTQCCAYMGEAVLQYCSGHPCCQRQNCASPVGTCGYGSGHAWQHILIEWLSERMLIACSSPVLAQVSFWTVQAVLKYCSGQPCCQRQNCASPVGTCIKVWDTPGNRSS